MKLKGLIPNLLTAALVASLGTAVALVAHAGADGTSAVAESTGDAMFRHLDVNHDNFVSREEAAQQKNFLPAFAAADANHDGKLSREEFAKADSIYDRTQAGAFIDDSVITAKIKTALIKDPGVSVLDVSVETDKGVVLLSGFVDNKHQAQRAVEIAAAVTGVKNVKSNLTVKN